MKAFQSQATGRNVFAATVILKGFALVMQRNSEQPLGLSAGVIWNCIVEESGASEQREGV
jgi:hypothetical protein